MRTEHVILSESRYDNIVKQLKGIQSLLLNQEILHKDILDFEEACRYLKVSDSFLYKKTANSEIPFRKPTKGKLYFIKAELNEWLTSNKPISDSELDEKALSIVKELLNLNPSKP
jgi:excisionase family DNA binding protein